MPRIMWAGVLLALAWGGWWLWAAAAAERAVERWVADRRAEGWQAEYARLDLGGFPLRFDAEVLLPALADPQTGVALTASALSVSAPAWWPGDVTVLLPEDAITLASPEGRATLLMQGARADMQLRPGAALELERLELASGPWSLGGPNGQVLLAEDLSIIMEQDPTEPRRYVLSAGAAAFQPGSVPRAALRVPESWPVSFDSFTLQMRAEFDRVWDRRAVEVSRPQPRRIEIALAEAVWGTLELRAAADLTIDAEGVPEGTLSLQARNWQQILTLAERAGLLPAALVPQAQSVLQALAAASGDPQAIDATLTLRDGLVLLGFVPLGSAPRIILR
ncbi:DUF2125 domain-containing protein [Roseobacter sinensis]|uniref:DUF2125 domain-containing protein n=1 Tax=Roseobacter sinensis TaxID=2931391 RepID=A0ABT3BAM5_9RHOB|nr:DUF2125 domain-containing protein [Roseobacter sp. WL0113]MCV3270628.1 DUF2125 domain-containing protein [Roseobacter sp. WL0113]